MLATVLAGIGAVVSATYGAERVLVALTSVIRAAIPLARACRELRRAIFSPNRRIGR